MEEWGGLVGPHRERDISAVWHRGQHQQSHGGASRHSIFWEDGDSEERQSGDERQGKCSGVG